MLRASLPKIHEHWAEELLGAPIPAELDATCGNCPMVGGTNGFDADTACCTYIPLLPNFLVGGLLSDDTADLVPGVESVRARMGQYPASCTPLGLALPPTLELLHRNGKLGFGRSRALRCPHLSDTRSCTIWPYRNGVCATWFCKHNRGQVGVAFWEQFERLSSRLERELAYHAALEMGLTGDNIDAALDERRGELGPMELDNRFDAERAAKTWGMFVGREAEFYRGCHQIISTFGFEQALSLAGAHTRSLAQQTRAAYHRLTTFALPLRVRKGTFEVVGVGQRHLRVVTYCSHNPIDVPAPFVCEALPHFDGRPLRDTLDSLASEHGIGVDLDLVRRYLDFGILTEVAGDAEDGPDSTAGELVTAAYAKAQPFPPPGFGHLDEFDYHLRMLADEARVRAYQEAIAAVVRPGMRVLEIGAGTGILSVLAAQRGARVTAVEQRPGLASLARAVAADNGVSERVEVVSGRSQDLFAEARFDLIFSELLGNRILDELVLETMLDARTRLLADDGRLMPNRVDILFEFGHAKWLAASQRVLLSVSRRTGVKLGALRRWTDTELREGRVIVEDPRHSHGFSPLSEEARLARLDLSKLSSPAFAVERVAQAAVAGTVNAVRLSFAIRLASRVVLTTAGPDKKLHWSRPVYLLPTSIEVAAGDAVAVAASYPRHGEMAIVARMHARTAASAPPSRKRTGRPVR